MNQLYDHSSCMSSTDVPYDHPTNNSEKNPTAYDQLRSDRFIPFDRKVPLIKKWQSSSLRHSQAAAIGDVGLLCGRRNNNLIFIDIDHDLAAAYLKCPVLMRSWTITRMGNLDRVKIGFIVTDILPDSANWFRPGNETQSPDIQLLSTGRCAQTEGLHPDGSEYEADDDQILEVTFDQVSTIWLQLTGEILQHPDKMQGVPKSFPNRDQIVTGSQKDSKDTTGFLQNIYSKYTTASIFTQFGHISDNITTQPDGRVVANPNTGLILDNQTNGWQIHYSNRGGGLVDAWAYCQNPNISFPLTQSQVKQYLHEMADAAGIPVSDSEAHSGSVSIDYGTMRSVVLGHQLLDETGLSVALRRKVKSLLFAIVEKGYKEGDAIIIFSVRDLALAVGLSVESTRLGLKWLTKNEWLIVHKPEQKADCPLPFLAHGYQPSEKLYSLVEEIIRGDEKNLLDDKSKVAARENSCSLDDEFPRDHQSSSTVENHEMNIDDDFFTRDGLGSTAKARTTAKGGVETKNSLRQARASFRTVDTFSQLLGDEAFFRGTKATILGLDNTLNQGSMHLISYLADKCCDWVQISTIIEDMGWSKQVIGNQIAALEQYGLIEREKRGRFTWIVLLPDWNYNLNVIMEYLSNYGSKIKRTIRVVEARILLLENSLGWLGSKKSRAAVFRRMAAQMSLIKKLKWKLDRLMEQCARLDLSVQI